MESHRIMFPDFAAIEIWPGPMEGIGSNGFVKAAGQLQLTDCWMTPFIRLSQELPSLNKIKKSIAGYLDTNLPLTIQLMGNDSDLLCRAAEMLLELPSVNGINLNSGCPSARVVKHNSGGGLLKNIPLLISLSKKLSACTGRENFSVKIRSGFDSPEDMKFFLPELTSSDAAGKIFFHYRTVSESYISLPKTVRNARIAEAVKLCGGVPLIANGDIDSVEDAAELIAETGCSGIMIARPWLRDPYLLKRFTGQAPDAESGRSAFFTALEKNGLSGNSAIEMTKMLWGTEHPRFKELCRK